MKNVISKEKEIMELAWAGEYTADESGHIYHLTGYCPHCHKNLYTPISIHAVKQYSYVSIKRPNAKGSWNIQLHRFVWMFHHKSLIPKDHVIHHRDRNKHNNALSNLACIPLLEHCQLTGHYKNKK